MNESSLSQQLREAFTPGKDGQIHLTHELLSQIPQFLTEHEELQRNIARLERESEAGKALAETLNGLQDTTGEIDQWGVYHSSEIATAISIYRTACEGEEK